MTHPMHVPVCGRPASGAKDALTRFVAVRESGCDRRHGTEAASLSTVLSYRRQVWQEPSTDKARSRLHYSR